MLLLLNLLKNPVELNIGSYKLHQLKGQKSGYWSIQVTANWRLIFRFKDGDVYDLDLVDYH